MSETPGITIALSAGGKNHELAARGVGLEHVEELMVHISRRLLMQGDRLAFGGTLGAEGTDLTESLIDAATTWLAEGSAKNAHVNKPETWPLSNYSAWPFHRKTSEERRAQLVGVCHFIDYDPPGVAADSLAEVEHEWFKQPRALLYIADALTEMRDQSARQTDMRIVWGGRIIGSLGWMAGILEEMACSLRDEDPVIVFGGFGGCASVIADYLLDPQAPWPETLSLEASADAGRDALVSPERRQELEENFEDTRRLLAQFRTNLHQHKSVLGISSKDYLAALQVGSLRGALELATRFADQRRKALS